MSKNQLKFDFKLGIVIKGVGYCKNEHNRLFLLFLIT